MKLEEATQHLTRMVRRWRDCRANGTPESANLLRFDALEVISTHLEATRWRDIKKEQPGPGLYLCRCQSPIDKFVYYRVELATKEGFHLWWVTHYQRIMEEES